MRATDRRRCAPAVRPAAPEAEPPRLGLPTPERARHDTFETRGVDPGHDKLLRAGSPRAVVYSRRVDDLDKLRDVLLPHELMALAVYSVCKEVARGRPSSIRLDGTAPAADWSRERSPLPEWALDAAHLVRYVEDRLDTEQRHLLSGYWRIICPQEDLPPIRWQRLARVLCNSEHYGQQLGAFKGAGRVLSMRLHQLIRSWEASQRLNRAVLSRLTRRALERL